MGKKLAFGVAATLSAFALAACTPTPTTSASSGSSAVPPAPTVTVTATVTVTPSPVSAPPPPDFDFTSFEGAQIGSTWAQMSTQIGLAVTGNFQCAWFGQLRGTEAIQTYAFTKASSPNTGSTFFYTQLEDLTTTGPFPHNAEGVGVGSTKAEVLAAYPGAVVGAVDDLGAGHIATITVPAPSGSSKYVFGISGNSRDPNTVDLLQWGSAAAGSQWSHLCTGF